MKKPKKTEKLLLDSILKSAKNLEICLKGLEIGDQITLIRGQLLMSQRTLSKRSGVPQSAISKIESGSIKPNIATLEKIMSALGGKLLIVAALEKSPEETRCEKAISIAKKKIDYLKGTMSLEDQEPDDKLLRELMEDEVQEILRSGKLDLWEEN